MYKEEHLPQGDEALTKRITRWVGIGSSVLVVGFLVYWAFNLGRRDASEVPVIAAMQGVTRTAPEGDVNKQQDYQGLEVNSVLEGKTPELSEDVTFAPRPDDLASISPAEADPNAPVEPNANVQADAATGLPEINTGDEEVVPNSTLVVRLPERRPELLFVPPAGNALAVTETPTAGEEAVATDEALPESVLPEVPEGQIAEVVADNEVPEIPDEAPAPEATTTADAAPETTGKVASGTPLIQLAANGDPQTTRDQWAAIQAANSDILGGKSLYVEQANVNGKTYYRLRVQGFSSVDESRDVCAALMARNIPCLSAVAQ